MSDDEPTDVSSESPGPRRRLPKSILWGMLLGFTFSLFPITLLQLLFFAPLPAFLSFLPGVLLAVTFFDALVAIVALPVFAVATLWANLAHNRRQATLCLAALFISTLSWWAGPVFHRTLIPPVRHACILRIIEDAKPLIAAIEQYQKDTGAYPENLDALLPRYLGRIPHADTTGLREFFYHRAESRDNFAGYLLSVPIGCAIMDFDSVCYWSSGCPYKIDGKTHAAIQDWVFFDD